MIRNVFGKAVTESTVVRLPEFDRNRVVTRKDLASVALALKSSQGKDDDEAVNWVEKLKEQYVQNERGFTFGWIYNATGSAITLVDSHNWEGCLVSNPYPVRIENGQWGMFLHQKIRYASSAAILYEGLNFNYEHFYWCVAWDTSSWKGNPPYCKVNVKIARDVDWFEDSEWSNIRNALQKCGLQHRANEEGWVSVISATPGPDAIFEALLACDQGAKNQLRGGDVRICT